MKNVRLFAVAASLGMFASTVVAAEPKTTVKWSDVPSVIKVDVDQKVIATAPTATVTASEEKVTTGSIYGMDATLNGVEGWIYSNVQSWTSTKDALETLSLGGYRFLAPGSAEVDEDVFVDQYNNVTYDSEEALFKALDEKYNYIDVTYAEDGSIALVTYLVKTNYNASYTTADSRVYLKLISTGSKKSDQHIIEDVVNYFVNNTAIDYTSAYYTTKISTISTGDSTSDVYTVMFDDNADGTPDFTLAYNNYGYNSGKSLAASGLIVLVDETKKGYDLNTTTGTYTNGYTYGQSSTSWAPKSVASSNAAVTVSGLFTGASNTTYTYYTQWDDNGTPTNLSAAGWFTAQPTSDTAGVTLSSVGLTVTGTPTAGDTLTATASVAANALASGTKYVITTASNDASKVADYKFTSSDVAWYVASGETALNAEFVESVTANEKLDAVYFEYTNDANRTVAETVDYKSNELYYKVPSSAVSSGAAGYTAYNYAVNTKGKTAGTLIRITEDNADYLFTNGAQTNLYLGSSPLTDSADASPISAAYQGATLSGSMVLVPAVKSQAKILLGSDYKYTSLTSVAKAYGTHVTVGNGFVYSTGAVGTKGYIFEAESAPNAAYNQITKLGKPGYVTVVDVSDADATATGTSKFQGASVVSRFEVKATEDYEAQKTYYIAADGLDLTSTVIATESLVTVNGTNATDGTYAYGTTTIASVIAGKNHTNSIYEVKNVPENDTEYYVLLDERGGSTTQASVGGLSLSNFSYSSSKETGILTSVTDKHEIDCKAVQLVKNGAYYPAFETQEELEAAVLAITGLDTPLVGVSNKSGSTFYDWYQVAKTARTANSVKSTEGKELIYKTIVLPTSATVEETKVVDSTSTDVKVTSNLDTIDTSVAGIKTLTYTATYKDEVVGTKDVTVVVAPKYLREYKNGKVAKLTSFYVSNSSQRYAEYVYDWTKMEATVTYYSLDDVAVSSETIKLK